MSPKILPWGWNSISSACSLPETQTWTLPSMMLLSRLAAPTHHILFHVWLALCQVLMRWQCGMGVWPHLGGGGEKGSERWDETRRADGISLCEGDLVITVQGPLLWENGACEYPKDTVIWDSSPWEPGSNEHHRCSPVHTEASRGELDGRPMIHPDNVLHKEFMP